VGDYVGKGDVLFEIETEKVNLQVESAKRGYLKEILKKTMRWLIQVKSSAY